MEYAKEQHVRSKQKHLDQNVWFNVLHEVTIKINSAVLEYLFLIFFPPNLMSETGNIIADGHVTNSIFFIYFSKSAADSLIEMYLFVD